MAVKLDKIFQDCSHPDPQIQTFALMSITRLSPQLVDAPDQIQKILARLKGLVNSRNPDVVFLARKAVNHLEGQFRDFIDPSNPGTREPDAMARLAPESPLAKTPLDLKLEPIAMEVVPMEPLEPLETESRVELVGRPATAVDLSASGGRGGAAGQGPSGQAVRPAAAVDLSASGGRGGAAGQGPSGQAVRPAAAVDLSASGGRGGAAAQGPSAQVVRPAAAIDLSASGGRGGPSAQGPSAQVVRPAAAIDLSASGGRGGPSAQGPSGQAVRPAAAIDLSASGGRGGPAAQSAPAPQRLARDLTREEILPLLHESSDPVYVASLVIALVTKGRPEDLDSLSVFLRHTDDRVRSNTVEVFQAHGTAAHVELLVPLLDDKNNRVVGNACMALSRFNHPSVPAKLKIMLGSSLISMRETAAYVLSTLQKPFVEGLLIAAASDPYEGVRLRAVKSLSRYITRESVNALKNALNDMDINICEAASDSLRQIKAALQARKAAEARPAAAVEAAVSPGAAPAAGSPPEPAQAPVRPATVAAAETTGTLADAEGAAAGPAKEPAPHAPLSEEEDLRTPAPVVEPPPAEAPRPQREDLQPIYYDLGMAVYHLCRSNALTNELLDGIFYEILRYQDFLRAYQVKKAKDDDGSIQSTIAKLEEKIRSAFISLGRQAVPLIEGRQVMVPDGEKANIQMILDSLRRTRRGTNPGA